LRSGRSCELRLTGGSAAQNVLIEATAVGTYQGAPPLRLVVTDITQRKQAEDQLKRQDLELRQHRADLEALTARLLTSEEDVRRTIASDLQEEYTQRISALMWELAAVEHQKGIDPQVKHKLQRIKQHLSQLSVDLHHLAHRLHSRFLEHCDLDVVMKEYIDELNTHATPRIGYQLSPVSADCSPARAVVLFRILQEALANALKHAEAQAVSVSLQRVDEEWGLTVRDTGKGYNPASVTTPVGFGFIIMRERLRAVGGRLTVESRPGRGTTLTASVPLTGRG
jgi:signal transduction histidine kinase